MAQSLFAKAFVNKAKKTFADAKKYKHKEGSSFGPADVPDGSFAAVVTIETSVPAKGKMEGIPIVRVVAAISSGEHEGKEPSQSFFCEGKPIPSDPKERPTDEQKLLGLLQWMLPDIDITEVEQVPDAIELVNSRGPAVIIGVRNTEDKTTKKKYQNVYFNKLTKSATFEGQETATEAGVNPDEADPDQTGPEDQPYVPAAGDVVHIDGEDGDWEVKSVSQANQTANLISEDGTARMNKISWTDLMLA